MNPFYFDFAENDDNGKPTGFTMGCQIGDLFLESKFIDGIPFRSKHQGINGISHMIRIHDLLFASVSFTAFSGNMAWNQYGILPYQALRLINVMVESGDWSVQDGPEFAHNRFDEKQDFTLEELNELCC